MGLVYSRPMLLTLRLIHIVAGAFWVGTAVFTAAFLIPTVRAVGPAGGQLMQHITQVRKLPVAFMLAGLLTVLSGIGLYSIASGGFSNGWMRSGAGTTFGIGGALALAAMLMGIFVAAPLAKRAAALGAAMAASGGKPSPEQLSQMKDLQARMARGSVIAASLLVGATAAMAVARYIP